MECRGITQYHGASGGGFCKRTHVPKRRFHTYQDTTPGSIPLKKDGDWVFYHHWKNLPQPPKRDAAAHLRQDPRRYQGFVDDPV